MAIGFMSFGGMLTGSGDSAMPVVEEPVEKLEEQQTTKEKEVEATQTVVVTELKK